MYHHCDILLKLTLVLTMYLYSEEICSNSTTITRVSPHMPLSNIHFDKFRSHNLALPLAELCGLLASERSEQAIASRKLRSNLHTDF